jgi:hypothetical protein
MHGFTYSTVLTPSLSCFDTMNELHSAILTCATCLASQPRRKRRKKIGGVTTTVTPMVTISLQHHRLQSSCLTVAGSDVAGRCKSSSRLLTWCFTTASGSSGARKVAGKDPIAEITAISIEVLSDGISSVDVLIATKFSWAARRETSRLEDSAYCLLGLFDVYMPGDIWKGT